MNKYTVFWGEDGENVNRNVNQMNFSLCIKADLRSDCQNAPALSPNHHLKENIRLVQSGIIPPFCLIKYS